MPRWHNPSEMEKYVNDEDYSKKEKTADNKNEGVIYRDIKCNKQETNRDIL